MAIQTTAAGSAAAPRKPQIPVAKYLTVIETIEKTISQKSSKERLSVVFRIAAGEYEGRKLYEDFYLSQEALWKLMDLCEAIGLPEGAEIDDDDPAKLMNVFGRKQVWVNLVSDPYKDNKGVDREGRRINRFDSTDPVVRAAQEAKRKTRIQGAGAAPAAAAGADGEVPF